MSRSAPFWWSAACCWLASVSASTLMAQQGERTPPRRELPRTGEAYFPLRPGAVWKYRRSLAGGVSSDVTLTCRGPVAAGNNRGFELWSEDGGQGKREFWRADGSGVFQFLSFDSRRSRVGVGSRMMPYDPVRWLPTPVGIETAWTWQGRVMPLEGTGKWPTVDLHGAVETFAEPIEVPAGKFEAVKVVVEFRWPDSEEGVRAVTWFVPDVGPVRRELYDVEAKQETLRERDDLLAYVAAPLVDFDPLPPAEAFVAAHADLWPVPPKLRNLTLPVLEAAVVTSFVVATAGADRRLLAVRGDAVTPVDFADLESLRTLWANEVPAASPAFDTSHLAAFAKLCLLLRRAAMGDHAPTAVSFRTSRLSSSGGAAGFTQTGTFTDGQEKVEVVVKDRVLQRVTITRE